MVQVAAGALLETALSCVDDFYARLFRDWPDAVVRRVGDCTLSFCGDPRLNGANHLYPHTPDALTGAVLDEAEAFFAEFNAVWTVIYTDQYMPQVETLLSERHYSPRWHSPLMVLDDVAAAEPPPDAPPPDALPNADDVAPPGPFDPPPAAPRPVVSGSTGARSVIQGRTPTHQDDILRVLRDAFGTSAAISRNVVRRVHLADGSAGVWHYLAYHGHTATACATVALHASDMATVWNVGTRPFYRRQGFASAIMRRMHADLRAAGVESCALMSSREGQALYERLGYATLARVYYMGPPLRSARWMD